VNRSSTITIDRNNHAHPVNASKPSDSNNTCDDPSYSPDKPNYAAVNATGPHLGATSLEFSPDGRSVACGNLLHEEKAYDVASGAALPGAPRWEACLAVELGWARGRVERIVRFIELLQLL
jgi:hypothetical protein